MDGCKACCTVGFTYLPPHRVEDMNMKPQTRRLKGDAGLTKVQVLRWWSIPIK